jgi:fibronectin type 3 domain-containing protein
MKQNTIIRYIIYIITVCFISAFFAGCGESVLPEAGKRAAPGVPTGITATKGNYTDRVVIEWSEVANAESYVVYKSFNNTDPELFKALAVNVKGTSYTDTPVNPDRIAYYRVAAANGSAWSSPSALVEGYALNGTPKPPAQVTVPVTKIGEITMTWTASINPDVTSYKIFRAEKMYADNYVQINEITTLSSLEYTDTTVIPDKHYYYKIVAVNINGDGVPSVAVTGIALQAVPGTPSAVAASSTYGEKIVVTWTAADAYAASYKLYRARDMGDAVTILGPGTFELLPASITGTMFIDKVSVNALDDKVLYYYKLQAVSSGGMSAESNVASGYRDAAIPAQLDPPSSVKASKGSRDQITVNWNAVAGCSGYRVYRCSTSDGIYIQIAETSDATIIYTDTLTNINNEKFTYYYKVSTLSTVGVITSESMKSYYAEGNSLPYVPDVPVVTAVMNHTNRTITVSWPAASRAASYNVYRADDGVDGTYNLQGSQAGLTYTDTVGSTIVTGDVYYYKVEAVNVGGISSLSDPKAGKVLATPTITSISRSIGWMKYTYTVNWSTAVAGATGYEIRYDDSTTVSVSGGSVVTTTFDIGNLNTHNFKIRAVDTSLGIQGNYSAVVNK